MFKQTDISFSMQLFIDNACRKFIKFSAKQKTFAYYQ